MAFLAYAGTLLGSTWASGVNLYLTVAGLGIAHRFEWINLPGDLDVLSNPLIIGLALVLYLIEFFADKIPYVDSTWDAVHTFIRPVGGALIAYLAASQGTDVAQAVTGLIGGTIALNSHVTKAGTRAMINVSPEPISNSVASVSEDVLVVGSLWLMITNPIVLGVIVILFLVLSVWLFKKVIRLFSRIFRGRDSRGSGSAQPAT